MSVLRNTILLYSMLTTYPGYQQLPRVDVNNDGTPDTLLYHFRKASTINAKDLQDKKENYDLDFIIQDGSTSRTDKFTIPHCNEKTAVFLIDGLARQFPYNLPFLRFTKELVILQDDHHVTTIWWDGNHYIQSQVTTDEVPK